MATYLVAGLSRLERSVGTMRPRTRRVRTALLAVSLVLCGAVIVGLMSTRAVLFPRTDAPDHVDALVVVSGANDDRYRYARRLAEGGFARHILVSQPPSSTYRDTIDEFCSDSSIAANGGRRISVSCFPPDIETTEGEATAATRIARERGYDSLLVLTYWGHVSRVRIYFEQCFDGAIHVTDTPRPSPRSRKDALLHEIGGFVKAFLTPAC